MDIKQINSAIMFGAWTDAEISSMINAVKFARAGLQKRTIRSIQVRSTVEFDNSRTGATLQGTVAKIGRKFVTVSTPSGQWRVPANMLRVV